VVNGPGKLNASFSVGNSGPSLEKCQEARTDPSEVSLLLLLLDLLPRTTAAFPAQIDSDLLIDSTGSQSPWYSQLGEGWLHLQLVAGSSTRYKGAFTDNLDKSTAFPASADVSNASAPVLTIQTHAGKFVFEMQSSFGSSAYGNTTTTSFPP
jgi:hypothetical protein